ncbi:MAG: 4Fe-4S dicluster domain-containing protein, partial [Mangrovicoccus sp.]
WPRIQAAMMDEDTITVAYRDWRGEPRGKHRKAHAKVAAETHTADHIQQKEAPTDVPQMGDCIDCNACVNVCPMGIDIRDGQQLECITCALCIDACDEIMDKIGKPRGLIDYMALTDEEHEKSGEPRIPVWKHVFRIRTLIYTFLWAAIGVGLVVALFVRQDISVTVAPIRNPIFVTMSDGSIRNAYDVRIRNQNGEDRIFEITEASEAHLNVVVEGSDNQQVLVDADTTKLTRVYLVADKDSDAAQEARTDVWLWITDLSSGDQAGKDTVFNGREAKGGAANR